MREDMFKVIVERPRRGGKRRDEPSLQRERRRDRDDDGEAAASRESLRARHRDNRKRLNENLAPLRRWLEAQVGRPWDKVYAELCDGIDRRSTVQQHVHEHVGDFVALRVQRVDGALVYPGDWDGLRPLAAAWAPALYVCPDSGLLRANRARLKARRAWKQAVQSRREAPPADRVDVSPVLQLHRRGGVWYAVDVAPLNRATYPGWDVLRHAPVRGAARTRQDQVVVGDAFDLYGRNGVYGWRKRQLSARELRTHGLSNE